MFPGLKPTFGATAPNTSFGGFGSNVTATPFGQTVFGKPATSGFAAQPTTFGATSTPLFGSNTQQHGLFATAAPAPSFGQTVTQTQPAFGGSGIFGANSTPSASTGLFGTNTQTAFGQQNKPTGFGFGTNTANTGFGGFGQPTNQATPQQQSSNLFASTTPNLFGNTSGGFGGNAGVQVGTAIKFSPVTGTDTMVKGSTSQTISTRHHCITCMKEYESKSLEELRFEDYQVNRKGPQQGAQPAAGMFSNMAQQPSTSNNLFGAAQTAATTAPLFGAPQSTGVFGQPSTAFGAPPASNAPNVFGKPLTTSFGTNVSTASSFPFTSSASTPNLFGQNTAAKPFGVATTQQAPLFGLQTPGFGSQTPFGGGSFTTPQSVGLFNQNKTTAPFTANSTMNSSFGGFGQNMAQNTGNALFSAAKPNTCFGGFNTVTSTAPTFGQPSFGQPNQPMFNSSFNKPATNMFGPTPNTNPLGGNNLFANANKPNTLFNNTLGGFNSTFGGSAPNTSFNLGTAPQTGSPATDSNYEQHILTMSLSPYGYQNLFNNVTENNGESKDGSRATNPKELNALLNTACKSASNVAEKLNPVQIFGRRKLPMFDGLEQRDDELLYNIRMNPNPKRLVISSDNKIAKKLPDLINSKSAESPRYGGAKDDNRQTRENGSDSFKSPSSSSENLSKESRPSIESGSGIYPVIELSDASCSTTPTKSKSSVRANLDFSDEEPSQDNRTEIDDEELDSDESIMNKSRTHLTGIKLTRSEYYTIPSLDELVKYISENGSCIVKGFTIGRKGYGNVYFPDEIDLSNLNLDEIIFFRDKEITVYPNDQEKPPLNEGLNRRAQVTLDKVWPFDKQKKKIIDDVETLINMNYSNKLRRLCEKQGTKFIEYRPETGSWVFKVEHFSKYGLSDSDSSDVETEAKKVLPKRSIRELRLKSTNDPKKLAGFSMSAGSTSELDESSSRMHHLGARSDTELTGMNRLVDNYYHSLQYTPNVDMNELTNISMDIGEEDQSTLDVNFSLYNRTSVTENISVSSDIEQTKLKEDSQESKVREPIIEETIELELDIFEALLDNLDGMDEVEEQNVEDLSTISDILATKRSQINNHNISNMVQFKGRSFKVGWSRDMTFLYTGSNSDIFTQSVDIYQVNINADYKDTLQDKLVELLECQLQHSDVKFYNEIPYFSPKHDCQLLKGQHNIMKKLKEDNYYRQIWSLCAALWDEVDAVDLYKMDERSIRREQFSDWLKVALNSEPKQSNLRRKIDVPYRIMECLSENKIDAAVELAVTNDYFALSCLISQLPSSRDLRSDMLRQLNEWTKSDAYKFIDHELLKIYALIAGETVIDTRDDFICIYEKLDWIRTLAMVFWYVVEPCNTVSTAVNYYANLFTTDNHTIVPASAHGITMDIRYLLMKLSTNTGLSLICLADPATHTDDKFDYRLGWLLLQTLQSRGQSNIRESQKCYMHMNFAIQLEQMGMWYWAIFVFLFVEDDFTRRKLVFEVLHRNIRVMDDYTPDYVETEAMLVEKLHIPIEWIYSVKAIKAIYVQSYYEGIFYKIRANEWDDAHLLFVQHVFPECFLNDFKLTKKFIGLLSTHKEDITYWDICGGVIMCFGDLCDYYRKVHRFMYKEENQHYLRVLRNKIMTLVNGFKTFPIKEHNHTVCLSEMAGSVSLILHTTLATIRDYYMAEHYNELSDVIKTLPMGNCKVRDELTDIFADISDTAIDPDDSL